MIIFTKGANIFGHDCMCQLLLGSFEYKYMQMSYSNLYEWTEYMFIYLNVYIILLYYLFFVLCFVCFLQQS